MGTNHGAFTHTQLLELVRSTAGPCVSIYMPLVEAGPQVQQNPLRLRNHIDEAGRQLEASGLRRDPVAELLAPLRALQASDDFWRHLAPGLALFAVPGSSSAHKLAAPVAETVSVGPQVEIRPLLQMAFDGGYFYLLAVSLGMAELYSATRSSIKMLPLENLPRGAEEFRLEDEPVGVQFHSGTGRGGRTAMYYGHGETDENKENAAQKFLEAVSAVVDAKLSASRYPLLIASEGALAGDLRPKLKYPHVLPMTLEGNPRLQDPEKLLASAVPLVEPLLEAGRGAAKSEIEHRQGVDGNGVADDLTEVLFAANAAAVDALFIRNGYAAHGHFDPATGAVKADVLGEDLVNLAAVLSVRNGGKCYLVTRDEMPGGLDIAASLRF